MEPAEERRWRSLAHIERMAREGKAQAAVTQISELSAVAVRAGDVKWLAEARRIAETLPAKTPQRETVIGAMTLYMKDIAKRESDELDADRLAADSRPWSASSFPWKPAAVIGLVVVAVIVVISTHGPSPAAAPNDSQVSARESADVTGESAVDFTDSVALLSGSCTEPSDKLASEINNSVDDLAANGLTMSAEEFARQTRDSIPASAAPTQCGQIMAALLVLLETGG